MQRREPAARRERSDETGHAQRNGRASLPRIAGSALEADPGAERDRDRKQERRPAEQQVASASRASAPSGPIRLPTCAGFAGVS